MSILIGLVRGVSGAAKVVVEIRKLMYMEDFGDEFTPNEEIAKVKY